MSKVSHHLAHHHTHHHHQASHGAPNHEMPTGPNAGHGGHGHGHERYHAEPASPPHKCNSEQARISHLEAVEQMQKQNQKQMELSAQLEENGGTQIDEDIWNQLTRKHTEHLSSGQDQQNLPLCDRHSFNIGIGLMIGLNAIIMGLETDLNKASPGDADHIVWDVFANIFTLAWAFEAGLRLHTHRWDYFKDPWNLLDFVLAWLSILDSWILPLAGGSEGMRSFGPLRMLRMLRLVRLVRLMRAFKELWLIIYGMISALRTLSWVGMLMSLILYICAIFVTEMVGHSCDDDYAQWADCDEMFSTVFRSVYTLFQVITLESWSMAVARPILRVQPAFVFFFIFFLFLTTFGLLNVVVGVIVESTLDAARSNEELMAKLEEEKRKMELRALRTIFENADVDGSGKLDVKEFLDVCALPEAKEKFRVLDLPVDDATELFAIIDDDNSGEITIAEFINGCLKLKGAAKAKDLAMIVLDIKSMKKRLQRIESAIGASNPDEEAERQKNIETLRSAFESIDQDGSGGLDRDEFKWVSEMPAVLSALEACEIDMSDAQDLAQELFDLLDADGSGEIEIDEFISGCLRLRGTAKSKDLCSLIVDMKAQRRDMAKRFNRLEHLVGGPGESMPTDGFFVSPVDSRRCSRDCSKDSTFVQREAASAIKLESTAPASNFGQTASVLNSSQKSALAQHGLPVVKEGNVGHTAVAPPQGLQLETLCNMSPQDAAARARADADKLNATAQHLYVMAAMLENGVVNASAVGPGSGVKVESSKPTVCCRQR